MSPLRKIAYTLLSFVILMAVTCVANFIFQIAIIFLDLVSRLDASSAYIIALWLVTGVFTTVITPGLVEQFIGKESPVYRLTGNVVSILSGIAVLFAIALLSAGHFRHDPQDFSLIFSNGYVFLSFFIGAGLMALVFRKLD